MAFEGQEELSLSAIIRNAIDQKLLDLNFAMPCIVLSYDSSKNMATVQPALQRKLKTQEEPINLPTISNVPVSFPRTKNSHVLLPLAANDEGMLIFQQRSIDRWVDDGGVVDPNDSRKFHLSDAVFIPGLHSQANPITRKGSATSVEIKNANAFIELLSSGKFKIKNSSDELIDLVSQLADQCSQILTNTAYGPQGPINAAQFVALKAKFDAMKG